MAGRPGGEHEGRHLASITDIAPYLSRNLRLDADSMTTRQELGLEGEHQLIQFTPRDGDVRTSTEVEVDSKVLALISALARKRKMTSEQTRSLALEVGAQFLLVDVFGNDIVVRNRKTGLMTTLHEDPPERKPSA